jgi:hypothetical protein
LLTHLTHIHTLPNRHRAGDVPQVSDSPQVHGSGFHICFDLAADATLGYILPTWLEPHQCQAAGG